MHSSIDPVHFWDQYRETACSKDVSSSTTSSLSHSLLPCGTNGTSTGAILNTNKLGGDTSSFLVVPTKKNFVPSTSGFNLTPTHLALKTIALAQLKAKKTSLLFAALTQKRNAKSFSSHSTEKYTSSVLTTPSFSTTSSASNPTVTATTDPLSPSLSSVLKTKPKTTSETDLDFKSSLLPYLTRESLTDEKESLHTLQMKLDGLLPKDHQWHELNQLRIHAGAPERSEKGIDRLLEYYGMLLFLENRIPFETDAFKGNFTWFDAFHSSKKVTSNCIQYEKASVLFNLAATYAQLGAQQKMWTSEGIKLAAVYFQKAAGVLNYIRDALSQRIRVDLDKSSDLSEETLNALFELMIAQAHECFVEKANMDFSSSQLTSQLCAQTGEHYELAFCSSTHHASQLARLLHPRFPKTWAQYMHTKHFLYTAVAHFHCPLSTTASHLGERIARLMIAKTISEKALKEAHELRGTIFMLCQFYHTQILNALHLAETENTMKFQYPIMDPRMLSNLKRLGQAVVVPLPFEPPMRLQKGLFCHVLFDETVRVTWLQTHLHRVHLIHSFQEASTTWRERIESQLQLVRHWLEEEKLFFSSTSYSETFQSTEFLVHQCLVSWTKLMHEENTYSTKAMVDSLKDVLQTCEEVLKKCQFVLNHVDPSKGVHAPADFYATLDLSRSELYTLSKSLEHLQTEHQKCIVGVDEENIPHVMETWSEEKLKALVTHADPKLQLHPEEVQQLEQSLLDVLKELRSLSLIAKKLLAGLQDPFPRLKQRVEDAEEQWTTFQDLQKASQQKFSQLHSTFTLLKEHVQQAKQNEWILETVYLQLRDWDQHREQAQAHLKAALSLSEKLNTLADRCETFPVQLPLHSYQTNEDTPLSLSSMQTSPHLSTSHALTGNEERQQRKTSPHLMDLKKTVQMQKIKYQLKKSDWFKDPVPFQAYTSTAPASPNLALQKETEKLIHDHYSDLNLPAPPMPSRSTDPVPSNGVVPPPTSSMHAGCPQKHELTEQWAATQVELAKRRKRLWKKCQSRKKAAANFSHPPDMEEMTSSNLPTPALVDKLKSDSGFTTLFHGVEGENMTETLSQLKLKNDEVLAHFSPTPSLRSSSSEVTKKKKDRQGPRCPS
ncbi:hypothetical protein HMI54_005274 [Coelomomyces lativittatus]|nr:hypothetical protein HMI54_005274 [Coelomomyces lativittatus]KAJ1511628.1 hypothetical protein HMI55_006515 [Coelomomyces lativittatus]KAJ1514774.1 hypothetical protein HMI56_007454 [Coelomomyces lativittatus]